MLVGERFRVSIVSGGTGSLTGCHLSRITLSPCTKIPGFIEIIDEYDERLLGYPWRHSDPAVGALQRDIQSLVEKAESKESERRELFAHMWALAHEAPGHRIPTLATDFGEKIPHMSEPWYCCAEPTSQQLQSF